MAQETNNVVEQIKHFDKITNSLFILTQSLFDNKEKVAYYQRELEGKLFRFGLANQSLINLIKGNQFTLVNIKTRITDMFSINSITRMQIESFLIIYYLFFDKVSVKEKNFRYDIYKVHGLQKQLGFKTSTEFPKKQEYLEKMKSELDEAISNIKSSDLFKNADEKTQQSFLKPKYAKLVKSEMLFNKSGIDDTRVNDMWKIYSNHAHSEHISDRQYNTAYKINKSVTESSSLIITINSILTSKIILNFVSQFESVNQKYLELDIESRNHIEIWSQLKTKKTLHNSK